MSDKIYLVNMNIFQLTNLIFSNPPKPAGTYIVDMNELATRQGINVFQTLMTILLNGANILFGHHISADTISESQYLLLKDYIKSFGFELNHEYKFNEDGIPIMVNIYFLPYIGTDTCNQLNGF
jgi:hypothetical protein